MIVAWLVIALLVAINALYVAAEFAAVAVEKSAVAALASKGDRRAAGLLAVLEDGAQLDRYIAACQIGITLSSLVVGAYGQATIARALGPWLERAFGLGAGAAASTAFVVVLLALTTLQVVLGELVPKSLALQFPERTALATYPPLRASVTIFRAFIWVLNGSGLLLLKPFGVRPGGHQHVHSPQEIAILLAESRRGGRLTADTHRRLERGLQLAARTVEQLMTPRDEVDALDVSTPPEAAIERILASPYGRLPVYRGSIDHVLGAVSTKDIAAAFAATGELPALEQMLRPIPVVAPSMPSHVLVRTLRRERSAKAIVVDEHGTLRGLVSIEDVLGDLFGEIGDELKPPESPPSPAAKEAR
jgi:putative hemolysin